MRVLMSEGNIQSQLLRDQDMRSLRGRERDSMDDRIQDDGELIQRNLVQDPDNPDDGELEGKGEE